MLTTVILLTVLNLLLNKYLKHVKNHGGVVLKNIKTISKVYGYMKKILILHKADRVAITKVSIEEGYILKQMIHEVSLSDESLISKLKRLAIEHDEYAKIKKYDELHKCGRFINEITIPHEKKVLSADGITHVIHIKLIDKVSTTYMLSLYFKNYNVKLSGIRKFAIKLYLRIIRNIFRKNIDKL